MAYSVGLERPFRQRYGGWVLRVWGASVALPGTTAERLASSTLLRGLILVEHARRHDLGPVDHLVVETEVIRKVRPPSHRILAVDWEVAHIRFVT